MVTDNKNNTLAKGELVELNIVDLNQHGQGVGKHDGLVVFADNSLPGETVSAQIVSIKKNYAIAELKQLLKCSENRVKPKCPLADICGGCAVQHLLYSEQIRWKQEHIASLFDRANIKDWDRAKLLPIIGMTDPWYYRAKVQIPFSGDKGKPVAGFYSRRSHEIVDADICYIQHPVADIVRNIIREYLIHFNLAPYNEKTHTGTIRHLAVRIGFYTGQVMVIIVTNSDILPGLAELTDKLAAAIDGWQPGSSEKLQHKSDAVSVKDFADRFKLISLWLNRNTKQTNVVMGNRFKLLYGKKYLEEKISGIKYRISPQAFFQVNPEQTERLYAEVIRLADLNGSETVLDLYCGTGSISLILAQKANKVIGVEIIEDAINDARVNASINKISNTEFIAAAAEKWLPDYLSSEGAADIVVIDPPRKGCDKALTDLLCTSSIPVIIYVSCNPASLARDISRLSENYRISQMQPVDMFPHSDSVECVVKLELRVSE